MRGDGWRLHKRGHRRRTSPRRRAPYGKGDDVLVSRSNNKAVGEADEQRRLASDLTEVPAQPVMTQRGYPRARCEVNSEPQRHGHVSGEEAILEL